MTKGGKTFAYSYGADGVRTQKTVDGVTTEYYTVGGKLLAEKTGDQVLTFYYDDQGSPVSVELNGTRYYYHRNLQGDVIGLYIYTGAQVVSYTYDPWGKLLSITDTSGTDIGTINPLRYRGYYYDTETGFYFLQSRYYDPTVGRFINADGYVSTGQGISSYNMFAYCLNDPVNHSDPDGNFCITACIIVIASGAVIGGALGAFNASATGGSVMEGMIEGTLLGAIGSACGFFSAVGCSAALMVGTATIVGGVTDYATQKIAHRVRTGQGLALSEVDWGRTIKTGVQTGISVFVDPIGDIENVITDAIGTAIAWGRVSTQLSVTDVIITNVIADRRAASKRNSASAGGGRVPSQRKMMMV